MKRLFKTFLLLLCLTLPAYRSISGPAGSFQTAAVLAAGEAPLNLAPGAPDPLVQAMIAQVSTDTLTGYVADLSGERPVTVGGSSYTITTRYSGAAEALQKVLQYVYETLSATGLNVQYFDYSLPGYGQRQNIIAEQPGAPDNTCLYLIGAHLDDTSDSGHRSTLAPGADDNASGVAALLTVANILRNYHFTCTLRYAVFTGEEQGMYGSGAYARQVQSDQEDLRGVLNLDMIAYNSDDLAIVDLHARSGNAGDLRVAQAFQNIVLTYALDLQVELFQDGERQSDHAAFWDTGFAAIMAIEDEDDFTPYYHSIYDRLSTLNPVYFTNFARAAVGCMAQLAGPVTQGSLYGHVSRAVDAAPLAGATILASNAGGQAWNTTTSAVGDYNLTLPDGTYTILISAPAFVPLTQSNVSIAGGQSKQLDASLSGPLNQHQIYTPCIEYRRP